MASDVEICNRALQILGAARINSLDEDNVRARETSAAYGPLRLALLRKHRWNFAIERDQLAADSTAPAFGRANSFQVPSDFLRLLPPYPEDNTLARDWLVEGRKILTDDDAPLNIRYVADIEDVNQMDSLFREALSALIAAETCEKITQSNTKIQLAREKLKDAVSEAKRVNAIENVPQDSAQDTWITVRA